MSADGTKVERRKSRRFPVAVPIEVSWRGTEGIAVKADAVARQVNANGGFLKMSLYPDFGSRVTLANFLSAQTVEARVLAAPHTREGVAHGVIVELIVPNESFWGVNLQVERTSAELKKLEKAMQHEGIDLRLLKEYRDAVDYIRSAAGMVQQLRECHLRGLDDGELEAGDGKRPHARPGAGVCRNAIGRGSYSGATQAGGDGNPGNARGSAPGAGWSRGYTDGPGAPSYGVRFGDWR